MFIAHLGTAAPVDAAVGSPVSPPPPPSPPRALFDVPFCGRLDEPGAAIDNPALVDFSEAAVSTPDQIRIEQALERADLSGRDILHVGVGNSQLAARLAARCRRIDGITVHERERYRAARLSLFNYRVLRVSKYDVALPAVLARQYDVIVDNNLASFACCGFHLMLMFSSYRFLLRPGGAILTDEQGMAWTAGDPRWRLTPADLLEVGRAFHMEVMRITDTVYALVRH